MDRVEVVYVCGVIVCLNDVCLTLTTEVNNVAFGHAAYSSDARVQQGVNKANHKFVVVFFLKNKFIIYIISGQLRRIRQDPMLHV